MPVIPATQQAEIKRTAVQSQPRQIVPEPLSWKYPLQKRSGRVAQVVQHLPSKREAPSPDPSAAKKKREFKLLLLFTVQNGFHPIFMLHTMLMHVIYSVPITFPCPPPHSPHCTCHCTLKKHAVPVWALLISLNTNLQFHPFSCKWRHSLCFMN
jgi:hypothetical protein